MTVTKYEINIVKYKMYSKVLPIEITHLGYRGTKNKANQHWIWNIAVPYKFVSPWSIMDTQ